MSANHYYFSFINQINISNDETRVMNSDAYIKVRDHINRHSFTNNWRETKQLIEEINQDTGINFMAAVYYAVAAAKTEGIKGLASGLEIVLAAIAQSGIDTISQKKQNDAINWMFGLTKNEVKAFELSNQDLRDLYRCERACAAIKDNTHSDQLPNLEIVQQLLSEFITQFQLPDTAIVKLPQQKRTRSLLLVILGVMVIALAIFFYTRQLNASLFDVIEHYSPKPYSTLSDDLSMLSSRYGTQRVTKAKPAIIEHYLARADYWTTLDKNQSLLLTEDWLKQVESTYGENPEVSERLLLISERKQTLLNNINSLTQRFINSRTQIANFKQSIEQAKKITKEDLQKVKDKVVEIENYSISLSPFLGRAEYISKQINENNLDTAENELKIFKRRVSGLLIKIREFEERIIRVNQET